MTPEPLAESDFQRLSDLLNRFGDKRSMNLEQLDGFLAAVACGPNFIPQHECLRAICGVDIADENIFSSKPELKELLSLVTRHHAFIAQTLQSGGIVLPLLAADEEGIARGNDWANGFMRGVDLRRKDWSPLLHDEENGGSLVPIFTLAHELDPDPEMRPYREPISAELREKLIIHAAAGVVQIFRYFKAQRLRPTLPAKDSDTYVRIAPKVGRNEPCPCGSGKKFKHCCGNLTVH